MKKKDQTLRQMYERYQKSRKRLKIFLFVLGGTVVVSVGFLAIYKRENIAAWISTVQSNNQEISNQENLTSEEASVVDDDSGGISYEDYLEYSKSNGYWTPEGYEYEDNYWDSYDVSESVVVYESEESDSVFSEETQRRLQELWDSIGEYDYDYSYDSNTSLEDITLYEVPEFDIEECKDQCNTLATTYYNDCISAYEKYMQSAEDAYNSSLNSCIEDLGRYDSVCKTKAQELYDRYMSSYPASFDYNYCLGKKKDSYNSCYESRCE